jgi:hypothetical protein
MSIAESISCGFGIIQSPDLEHLRIKIEAALPDSHLDDYMLSLKLRPNTPVDEAKKLEDMLNEHVEALWVSKTSELEQ